MSRAPIFEIARAYAPAVALLGSNPFRLFLFGEAPQGVQDPYAVWQLVSGSPENTLADRPTIDRYRTQVDVYGTSAAQVRQIVGVLREAWELDAYIVSFNVESRDPETNRYRSGFDLDWIVYR